MTSPRHEVAISEEQRIKAGWLVNESHSKTPIQHKEAIAEALAEEGDKWQRIASQANADHHAALKRIAKLEAELAECRATRVRYDEPWQKRVTGSEPV